MYYNYINNAGGNIIMKKKSLLSVLLLASVLGLSSCQSGEKVSSVEVGSSASIVEQSSEEEISIPTKPIITKAEVILEVGRRASSRTSTPTSIKMAARSTAGGNPVPGEKDSDNNVSFTLTDGKITINDRQYTLLFDATSFETLMYGDAERIIAERHLIGEQSTDKVQTYTTFVSKTDKKYHKISIEIDTEGRLIGGFEKVADSIDEYNSLVSPTNLWLFSMISYK